jgi:hypothetical protein
MKDKGTRRCAPHELMCSKCTCCSAYLTTSDDLQPNIHYAQTKTLQYEAINITLYNRPTPYTTVLSEKLTVPQLVKKFPAFYDTRKFNTAFTSVCHLPLILSQINPVHASPSYFSKFHFNTIL